MRWKDTSYIKHRGSPTQATLRDGTVVEKELMIPFLKANDLEGEMVMVRAVDYYDHFIYKTPFEWKKSVAFMCTCGSMAVIVDPPVLAAAGYPESDHSMLVCKWHMDDSFLYGFMKAKHATSYVNRKDFQNDE